MRRTHSFCPPAGNRPAVAALPALLTAAAFALSALVAAVATPVPALGQGVSAADEPRHHRAFADAEFRVLRVEVPPHDSTLLHRHATDYFWIALGDADVVSAVLGQPEARTVARANSLHFSKGPFSHVAHNSLAEPFRNVTIELLFAQTNPTNLCERVLPALPLNCEDSASVGRGRGGASIMPSFATDRLHVSLATVSPGGTVRGVSSLSGTLLIAAEESAAAALSVTAPGRTLSWTRGVLRLEADAPFEVYNSGNEPSRVIVADVR